MVSSSCPNAVNPHAHNYRPYTNSCVYICTSCSSRRIPSSPASLSLLHRSAYTTVCVSTQDLPVSIYIHATYIRRERDLALLADRVYPACVCQSCYLNDVYLFLPKLSLRASLQNSKLIIQIIRHNIFHVASAFTVKHLSHGSSKNLSFARLTLIS